MADIAPNRTNATAAAQMGKGGGTIQSNGLIVTADFGITVAQSTLVIIATCRLTPRHEGQIINGFALLGSGTL